MAVQRARLGGCATEGWMRLPLRRISRHCMQAEAPQQCLFRSLNTAQPYQLTSSPWGVQARAGPARLLQ